MKHSADLLGVTNQYLGFPLADDSNSLTEFELTLELGTRRVSGPEMLHIEGRRVAREPSATFEGIESDDLRT
jgi:hypothetical protein